MKKKKLYLFNWIGGGYNTILATDKKDAKAQIAKTFGKTGICSVESAINIRIPKKGEVEKIDASYSGMFD
jgi:hypothetical protein